VKLSEEAYLAHYGILRKSGRYPWGSGGTQSKRNKDFLDTVADLRSQGLSEAQIAEGFGIKTTQLRAARSIARNEQKQQQINMAQRLKDKGYSNVAIGERMGINESSVRSLLDPGAKDKADVLEKTSEMLKREVEEKKYVDVGTDVHRDLPIGDNPGARIGISSTKFDVAVARLREEGYTLHYVQIKQLGTGKFTTVKVLAAPGVKYSEVLAASKTTNGIKQIAEHSEDGGHTYDGGFQKPISVSSKRVAVRYGDEGGAQADGMIYVRPGAKDLHLGAARYAQVRVAIDGTHYLKGMAVYKDDLPAGVDLMFNTNKGNTGNKKDAMKKMSDDPDVPFGAMVRQHKDSKGKVNSALNIVNEEGDWDKWSRNLPSQMLSKQRPDVAKSQLNVTYERRREEFERISALTNPVVRQHLLEKFADSSDAAAVHLKAAAMPRQATKVIVPIASIKEHEIYAPSLRDGERVSLVRFPHGGTFEIPEVTVNNKNREARKVLGSDAPDAIGLHHKVAERLSGADFDGDTVLAIPNNRGQVKSSPALQGLKGFEPKAAYKPYDGMRTIDGGRWNDNKKEVEYPRDAQGNPKKNPAHMQQKMGDVSNLITDMTIKGASHDELARAVRHSMVIIDAEKHSLDYKSSHRDNGIASLKEKYQGKKTAGASTLISRAGSPERITKRKPRPASEGGPVDRKTGKKVFVDVEETFVNRKGETVKPTEVIEKLANRSDAHSLSSGTPIERIYADHSNRLKALANESRKTAVNTKPIPYSPSAKKVYSREVADLSAKLDTARRNAPRERQAQALANAKVAQKKAANPSLEPSDIKKLEAQALAESRVRVGAKKQRIELTEREWDAIQAGAISPSRLRQILQNADIDDIRRLATPKQKVLMTGAKTARAQAMLAAGYTQAEVADALGVSLTTLKTSLSGGE
jgi:DNA-binding CsgD family transcriptional regulator